MRITTDHASSSYGLPVILDDAGAVMDYAAGVRAIRRSNDFSTADLAALCDVSPRSVEGWEQGRPVPAAALNVMARLVR